MILSLLGALFGVCCAFVGGFMVGHSKATIRECQDKRRILDESQDFINKQHEYIKKLEGYCNSYQKIIEEYQVENKFLEIKLKEFVDGGSADE